MAFFDWNRYLELAGTLSNITDPALREAAMRSAISRVFYAAYILARDYARDYRGVKVTGYASDYPLVFDHYRTSHPYIDRELKDLKSCREKCDYNDQVDNLELQMRWALQLSAKIIGKLPPPK